MKYIGAHVSAAGGVENTPQRAKQIGSTTFALFVKNQKQWKAPPFKEGQVEEFKKKLEFYDFDPSKIVPHAGYLINLAHPDQEKRSLSLESFLEETRRVEELGLLYINVHPGSHLRAHSPREACMAVSSSLDWILERTEKVIVLLENTAGQGSNLGSSFDELSYIIENTRLRDRLGVCIDTCHSFAAGYPLTTREGYEETFSQYRQVLDFDQLKAFHLNDSQHSLNSKKDRHAHLGEGKIGWNPFKLLMQDPRMEEKSFILETREEEKWPAEIKKLKEFVT